MTKLIITTLAISTLAICFMACKTTKYTPSDFPEEQITFGSGGGFSGIVTDYTLLANGQLFKRSSTDNRFVELKKVKKNVVEQAFKNYTFLGIDKLTINNPGNLYYFIEFKAKDNTTHKVVWGGDSAEPVNNLETYYGILSSLIATKN